MKKQIPNPLHRQLALVTMAGLLGLTTTVRAQLAYYDFSSTTSPADPTTENANLDATSVAWSGLTGTYGVAYQAGGQAYARFDALSTTFDAGKYLSFTVTANDGYLLNLSSLLISFGGNNTHASVARTAYASIRTDAEDTAFSTNLAINPGAVNTASVVIPANTTTSSIVYEALSIDLSGTKYQNLSAITFRIYGYASASATNAHLRIDDITLNGTVAAVPEPATWAIIMGIGVLGSALLFRRRSACC